MAEKQPIRITPSQAANLFGVSEKTIRRAIKNEELRYIVVRGVYKMHFDSLFKRTQTKPTLINKLNQVRIGQYLEPAPQTNKWKIKNRLYSPNPKFAENIAKNDPDQELI